MSPIVFKTEDWERFHGKSPKPRPLWPRSGVVHGLRLTRGMRVEHTTRAGLATNEWFEQVMIMLPDGWSATGQHKSFLSARRIAVEKVKARLEELDA